MRISYFRIYLLLALLMAVILSPFPYSAIAAFLLLLHLYLMWKTPMGGLLLPIDLLSLIAIPFLLDIVMPMFSSALVMLPALPLLNNDLRYNINDVPLLQFSEKMTISQRLKLIIIALSVVLLISLVTSVYVLSLSVAIVFIYLGWLAYKSRRILAAPIAWQQNIDVKVVAGDKKQVPVQFDNTTGKHLYMRLEAADKWVSVSDAEFGVTDTKRFDLTFQPPLAGPQALQLKVSVQGPLGLLQAGYTVDCARLVVIPRARYSAYLAKKYLEGGAGAFMSYGTSLADSSLSLAKGTGIEYHSSHLYSPGDRITDIDWKHTAHYRELVVKKYQNDYGNSAIVMANLTTTSADEADVVASSLVNSVLALAMSSIHGSLVAYDEHEVVRHTPMMSSNMLLKMVLGMIESISFKKASTRYLSPPNMAALKRTRRKLANVDLEPAKRLLDILDMEIDAAKMSTSHHPLSLVINKAIKHVPPPATIIPITAMNHDVEALSYLLPNLQARGYRIVAAGTDNKTLSRIGIASS